MVLFIIQKVYLFSTNIHNKEERILNVFNLLALWQFVSQLNICISFVVGF